MIQSASILPFTERITWGRAIQTGAILDPINANAQVDVVSYRRRDQELAYRDLIIAALVAQVSIGIGDVWQFTSPRMQLPAAVTNNLIYSTLDAPGGVRAPGTVDHVLNSSIPLDAGTTDQQLYARDLLLYEALRQTASILATRCRRAYRTWPRVRPGRSRRASSGR